jgi:hypothetical protein
MATIHIYQYFVVNIDDHPVSGGSLSKAKNITLGDGKVSDATFTLVASTPTKIWDAAETLGDFDFLWLETDFDTLIQFTINAGGTDVYVVKELKGSGTASEMGPALVLGSDASQLLDGSIDTFDGTADTIDEIWAYHDGGDSTTVRLRRFVGT